jgi:hypothetical protein
MIDAHHYNKTTRRRNEDVLRQDANNRGNSDRISAVAEMKSLDTRITRISDPGVHVDTPGFHRRNVEPSADNPGGRLLSGAWSGRIEDGPVILSAFGRR